MADLTDKRDVLIGYVNYLYEFPDSPRRASADSILNELHQNGWAVVPKADADLLITGATDLARALRLLVNAGLPIFKGSEESVDLDTEQAFWVAARNARATLSSWFHLTGVNGEQDPRG